MNKSYISKNYNVDKIVTAKELASLSRTYKDNLETIIVMMKRKTVNPPQPPAWFKEFEKSLNLRLTKIETNQQKDRRLLMSIINLNNLKTE